MFKCMCDDEIRIIPLNHENEFCIGIKYVLLKTEQLE